MYKKILIGRAYCHFMRMVLLTILLVLSYALPCDVYAVSEAAKFPALDVEIGQMLIVGFGGLAQRQGKIIWQDKNSAVFEENSNIAKDIAKFHVGGVILFSYPLYNERTGAFIRHRNVQTPRQLKKLTSDLQRYAAKQAESGHLPLLVTVDQEGGMVDRLPTSLGFPEKTWVAQALGDNERRVFNNKRQRQISLRQTYRYASKMAAELAANHFNVNFFPLVDVNINPLNPIIGAWGRSFSDNPEIVADQAWQFIQAFHAKGILATLKHFPGHGSSQEDSHLQSTDVTDTYQMEKELLPYRILINKGYQDLIMTAHVTNGQIDKTQCKAGLKSDRSTWCPGTLSYVTLTKLLREQLGFKGLIVSDAMDMNAVAHAYPLKVALEKAINAGVDLFILGNAEGDKTEETVNAITQLVQEGRVSKDQIDRAYERIMRVKGRLSKGQL